MQGKRDRRVYAVSRKKINGKPYNNETGKGGFSQGLEAGDTVRISDNGHISVYEHAHDAVGPR